MLTFYLRRRYVIDVETVFAECLHRSRHPRGAWGGWSIASGNLQGELDEWMQAEAAALDVLRPEGMAAKGSALIRARRWVGMYFVWDFLGRGFQRVPKRLIKKSFDPACTIANCYLEALEARAPNACTATFRDKLEYALDEAMA